MYHFTKTTKMTKIEKKLFSMFMLLFCVTSFQSIMAVDVPLKADVDPNATKTTYQRAPVRLPLSVFQNETDITLDFTYSVGVAQITVEDEFGGIVYQEALDTTLNPSLSIETSDWDGGNYKLKVSYGSINLSGVFSL